jgi:hypothetical protein
MRNKKLFLDLLVAICLVLLSPSLFAQSNNLARLFFVKVKTGHGADFAAALKMHTEWRKQQDDPWTWIVHQVANGKNLGDYVIRSGGHTWSDFDDYEEFSAKGGSEFYKAVGSHIKDISSIITAGDTVNVNWPENPADVNLISVITYNLKPGHGPAFNQAVSKYHKAIKENNREVYYGFNWNVNGSSGPRVNLVLPYKNWADDAKELYEDFNDTYTSMESMILRVRRDLSVLPDN